MSFVLTLIGQPGSVTPALLDRVAAATGAGPVDLLSPGEAADLPCADPPDPCALRHALDAAPVDAVVTQAENRRKRLLIADMDSTIITSETLDELAIHAGVGEHVAAITRRAMAGEIDFPGALRERVALLHGLGLEALEKTWGATRLMPGARELIATMRAHGAVTALVSGGFTWFTSRVAASLGFDVHRSNVLLDDGTVLLGRVQEPILGRDAKLATLRELASERGLAMADCLAVGDGANDLDMIRAAGLGVAFHAKPIVAEAAQARIDHCDLRALLFMQGYRAEDFCQ
ncbi:MAG TPA: phosphoserine phosphatase SerB [Acetobacteraceae bacterium]|nr:phosphoserine phosphatase SerB [Acetobacteraceae bacterium]